MDLRSSHLANGIIVPLTNLKDTHHFSSAFIQSFGLAFLEINVRVLKLQAGLTRLLWLGLPSAS